MQREGDMLRDPKALEGVSRRWGPQGGGNLETSLKVPAHGKLLRTMSPALWDPASALVHTPVRGGKGDPAPASPRGAFPEGGAKQKVEESGGRTVGPYVCSPGTAAPGWVAVRVRAPRSPRNLGPGSRPRPRLTPPRPRPPGAQGTIWPAPRQGPRLEESCNSGLRVAGKRCVRA